MLDRYSALKEKVLIHWSSRLYNIELWGSIFNVNHFEPIISKSWDSDIASLNIKLNTALFGTCRLSSSFRVILNNQLMDINLPSRMWPIEKKNTGYFFFHLWPTSPLTPVQVTLKTYSLKTCYYTSNSFKNEGSYKMCKYPYEKDVWPISL